MEKKRPSDYLINGIVKSYTTLDDTIMKGVNAGVRGWNWLTGETKADLASKVGILGAGLMAGACMIRPNEPNYFGLAISSLYGLDRAITPSMMIEREAKAASDGLKDINVEKQKIRYKFYSPALLFMGLTGLFKTWFSDNPTNSEEDNVQFRDSLLGSGFVLLGASYYIERANSIKPRKNVFRRAGEKLAEIVRDYKTKPLLEPSRVPVN